MLAAVDIGNTFTKFGIFDGDVLTSKLSIPTKRNARASEIRRAIGDDLAIAAEAVFVCSVVPDIENGMRLFLKDATGLEPVFVDNSFDFGISLNYAPRESLGTDRLVAMYAAVEKYGAPCIVCSLGTATTIDVVSADRQFLGGLIAPGMNTMAAALYINASRLPRVRIDEPAELLGNSTAECIRSGVYYGYVEMVTRLIARCAAEVEDPLKIVTGGNAGVVSEVADVADPDLVLTGLRMLARSVQPT